MKLSMRFLQDKLRSEGIDAISDEDTECRFRRVRLYYAGIKIEPEELYFCLPNSLDIPETVNLMPDVGLVLVQNSISPPGNIPVLWVPECADYTALYNKIHSIFSFFDDWSEEVYQSIIKKRDIKEIFELLNKVTLNPWYMADSSYRVLTAKYDADVMEMSVIWKFLYMERHLPLHIVLALVENGGLNKMNHRKKAYIPEVSPFNMPFVSKTIYTSNGILGHFYIVGVYNVLGSYEIEIADFFGDLLSYVFANEDITIPTMGRFYDNYFIDLVRGIHFKDNAVIDEVFRIFKWNSQDQFIIAALCRQKEQEPYDSIDELSILTLENMYACKCFSYDNKILAIFNISREKRLNAGYNQKDLETNLYAITKKYNGFLGYSEPFSGTTGFNQLNLYYKQATIALSYCEKQLSDRIILNYSTIVMDYVCNVIKDKMDVQLIYHKALIILKKYDMGNHTNLYDTLQQYLICEQNTVQTAKNLFIHRNTLLHRLDKIQSLTEVDLDNADERMRLMISYHLQEPQF